MIGFDEITAALAERKRRVLLVAETALPSSQFQAFRKVMLDEFGESGLLADLRATHTRHGGAKPHGISPSRG